MRNSTMTRTRLETIRQIQYWVQKSVERTVFCLGSNFRRDLTRRLAGYLGGELNLSHKQAKRKAREIIENFEKKLFDRLTQALIDTAQNDTNNEAPEELYSTPVLDHDYAKAA